MEWLIDDLIKYGVKFGVALLILAGGFWVSNIITGFVKRRMIKRQVDASIISFITPIISIILKLMVLMSSINIVGIQITSFAAVIGGLAVGVGLALQGSLSNFAGGILIIAFKPFKVGDTIEALGHNGKVEAISILYTTIVTDDRQVVVLPNSALLNNPVKNFSAKNTRRILLYFGLTYESDMQHAKKVLLEMLENDPDILKNEPMEVEIAEYTDIGIRMVIKAFTKRSTHSVVFNRLKFQTKEVLNANKISFSFNKNQILINKADH